MYRMCNAKNSRAVIYAVSRQLKASRQTARLSRIREETWNDAQWTYGTPSCSTVAQSLLVRMVMHGRRTPESLESLVNTVYKPTDLLLQHYNQDYTLASVYRYLSWTSNYLAQSGSLYWHVLELSYRFTGSINYYQEADIDYRTNCMQDTFYTALERMPTGVAQVPTTYTVTLIHQLKACKSCEILSAIKQTRYTAVQSQDVGVIIQGIVSSWRVLRSLSSGFPC